MNTIVYFFLGFGYICLLIWGLYVTKYEGLRNLSNVFLLVIIGLIYDNFIIALGKYIGEGSLLENLSYARYWLHALFTPTLILFAWSICFKVGILWAKKAFWKILAFLLSIGLFFYDSVTTLFRLELIAKWENGVLTYEAVQPQNHFIVTLITLVLLIVGFILLKNFHFSWLIFGALVMIVGSLLTIWIRNFPIMNVLEFVLILALLKTKQFQIRNQKTI